MVVKVESETTEVTACQLPHLVLQIIQIREIDKKKVSVVSNEKIEMREMIT